MARIAGVDLPKNKRMEVALTYVHGIGRSSARHICSEAGIDVNKKSDLLEDDEVVRIRQVIERSFKVEGDLRREVTNNLKRLAEIGSYRGLRHRRNLPARGQRTHTNARTRKGPRRAIAGRKPVPVKK
jgi:small subunit ribosomal protein S13